MNIGFMQGRMSPMVNGLIQAFPSKNWSNEFKSAAENNFHAIEWTIDFQDWKSNPFVNPQAFDDINKLRNKYNVSIPSVTCDSFMHVPFWRPGPAQRSSKQCLSSILCSAPVHATSFIVIPLVDQSSLSSPYDEDLLLNELSPHTPYLEKSGLRILFESDYAPLKLAHFINRFPENCFGVNYDSGNSASLGYSIDEEFTAYGNRIYNVHIKDRSLHGATCPLGHGDVDFSALIRNLKSIKYTGNLILQTARDPDDQHVKALCDNRTYLRSFLAD